MNDNRVRDYALARRSAIAPRLTVEPSGTLFKMPENQVVLVDGDAARREEICAWLEAGGIAVAAYGSASLYGARPSAAALFLIADEKRALQSMTIFLGRADPAPAIIAYRPEPAVHDVVEAMKLGIADYLAWPFGPATLLQRLRHRCAAPDDGATPVGPESLHRTRGDEAATKTSSRRAPTAPARTLVARLGLGSRPKPATH